MVHETDKPISIRRFEEAVRQSTFISSLLGGFSLTTMTLLLALPSPNTLLYFNFVSVSLATCLFVGASLLGGYINLRSTGIDINKKVSEDPWQSFNTSLGVLLLLTASGLVLFLIGVCLLSFQMGLVVGVTCTVFAIPIFWLVYFQCKNIDVYIEKQNENTDESDA